MLRLITIPISHYCEKARWALDRAQLPYREEGHVQVIHRVVARRAGGGSTVPVLVADDGQVISESADILDWVDRRLEPGTRLFEGEDAGAARALCARLDERLGPTGRRLIYVHVFARGKAMLDYNNQGVPRWEDRALRAMWPLAQRAVSRLLDIRPGVEVQDEAAVRAEFDNVAALLADGRPYLFGERFGGADLTFAALAAPVIAPIDYGVRLPRPDEIGAATAGLVQRFREHPAGAFAVRMVAEHRRAPALAATA
ncbi:MAG TPA: glutathione S-transferase family protein [Solirubrobacteraceae bacterium]|nr:glutathione S-transferase family protein [Solirubrobacteraceae bacterium]